MTSDLSIILAKAQFLANHAMTFHLLTAEYERMPAIGGMDALRGAALCRSYLEVASELRTLMEEYRICTRVST